MGCVGILIHTAIVVLAPCSVTCSKVKTRFFRQARSSIAIITSCRCHLLKNSLGYKPKLWSGNLSCYIDLLFYDYQAIKFIIVDPQAMREEGMLPLSTMVSLLLLVNLTCIIFFRWLATLNVGVILYDIYLQILLASNAYFSSIT